MKRFLFACVPLLLGLGVLPALAAAPPAAGPNFQVNQLTTGPQSGPDVAQDTAGDIVAVWIDSGHAPIVLVKARLFNATGAPTSGEIVVAQLIFGTRSAPRVAMTPLGEFVVAWEDGGNIFLRRFNRLGQGNLLAIDPPPLGDRRSPDVTMDAAGNAYAVWSEPRLTGDLIFLQRYGADGFPVGAPEQVNQPAPFTRDNPRIAADPAGDLLVTWDDTRGQGGFNDAIYARRYAASGARGPEVPVDADTLAFQLGSAPILYPDGTGAVVFNDYQANAILVRRLDAAGMPSGAPIPLGDLGGHGFFHTPGAAAGPDRTVLVAWLKGDALVHARFFDSSWSPLGGELTLSADTTDFETDPAVSAGGAGSFAAVWASNGIPVPTFPIHNDGRDGSQSGIFGQAFLAPGCAAGSEVLCLQGGRFQARVTWKNPYTGETGTGKTLPLTGDTGAFWFFDPNNLELMLKVLDGRLVNGYFWVFYGSLSNVEYTLTLTDTVTGTAKMYHNAPFQFGSQEDVTAFKVAPSAALATQSAPLKELAAPPLPVDDGLFEAPNCPATPTAFCAQNRFRVEVSFVDPRDGIAGQGRAVKLTADTGIFWFFSPSNLELMVKVLDGGGVNGHFWVFYGALSDVDYTITVTDTATGAQKTYHNPLHHLASGADLDAFPAAR